ncbi:MAG: ATP synthase F1 subunit epsilon [Phycisphaerae bacterium]|nr:ATP synthase F1 subunit epsilon [Phycisphaerae bacterium]
MAKESSLQCSVITPEEQVLETTATAVVIPAHDGLIGILKDRAPLLCELGTGVLRVDTTDQGSREFCVDGGFAQVLNNEVIVLTERAAAAEDIVRADVEKALAEAEKMPMDGEQALKDRRRAIDRARTQLRIARK